MKKFKIKNKDNKIYHGRGNSLRNEVRGWVELPRPSKTSPTGIGKICHSNFRSLSYRLYKIL